MYPKIILLSPYNHLLVSPFIQRPLYFVAYTTFYVYFTMFLSYYKVVVKYVLVSFIATMNQLLWNVPYMFTNFWNVFSTIVKDSTICWAMLSSFSFYIFGVFFTTFFFIFSIEIQNILQMLLDVICCNPLIVFFPVQANMTWVTNLQKTKILGLPLPNFQFFAPQL